MPKKGAFVLTPVGPKEGRYDVRRVEAFAAKVATHARTGQSKVVAEGSPRSKEAINSIVRTYATGLKRLADR